jgi:hypothetical protein
MQSHTLRDLTPRIALGGAGLALAAVVANFVRSGTVLWGGVVVIVLGLVVWQRQRPGGDANGA